jgi:TolB-like protein
VTHVSASPERIGPYRLIARMGEGGMGLVYRAVDERIGRTVALKVLNAARAGDLRSSQRFLDEARAIGSLDHPHVCTLYEYGEDGDRAYLAMQLVEGETLAAAIGRGPLDEPRVREILVALAQALDAAHAVGILHRDVKSENVLLGLRGEIKLADFGLARISEAGGVTSTGALVGTPAYFPPEILRGESATPESDQFSLGIVAYESLTGVRPFAGHDPQTLMYAILNTYPDPPTRRRPGIDPGWNEILMKALAKDAGQRYENVRAFGEAVRTLSARTQAAAPATGAEAPAAPAGPRSVAVLFFENQAQDPENDYFCDGITEDILADLAKLPGLAVASRNAVLRYRGRAIDARQVAAELGVESIVQGRVRRVGSRVRITAELTDPRSDFQLWSERFDRSLDDVFAVQEEIAQAIAGALGSRLSTAAARELRSTRPRQVEAYDLYLKGRELYRRYTHTDVRAALDCFDQAVGLDPGYALAWAGIADCCAQMLDRGWDNDPTWRTRGLEAARRAIELDPRRPEGHKARAVLWQIARQPAPAIESLERALRCDPRYIPALINLAYEHLSGGDFAAAEQMLRRAVMSDPAYGLGHLMLAALFIYTRRYREAIAACHRAQIAGESPFHASHAYAMRAQALVALGDRAAARSEIEGGRAAGLSPRMLNAAEALLEAHDGDTGRARWLLENLDREPPGESYGCEIAAAAAGCLGDAALSARLLAAAERIDQRHWPSWRLSPDLARVRDSGEFRSIIGDRGRRVVWPIEAPTLSDDDRKQFDDVSSASGRVDPVPPNDVVE